MEQKKIELEDRLITFAAAILTVSESLPRNLVADHVAEQLMRRGINPLYTYVEAQNAGSRNNFIEKMQLSTNELKGTVNFLKVIKEKNWISGDLSTLIDDNEHLIAIFAKSLSTARKNSIL